VLIVVAEMVEIKWRKGANFYFIEYVYAAIQI
jgi:hypothetical protein